MRPKYTFQKLVLICLIAFYCIYTNAEQNDLWKKGNTIRQYSPETLFEAINGGAEIYLEFGFKKLTITPFSNGTDELSIELYEMDCPESALGIYLHRCSKEIPEKDVSFRNTFNPYQWQLLNGSFYIQVNNFSGNSQLKPVMKSIVFNMIKPSQHPQKVSLVSLAPKKDLIPGSEKLIRGPYALQHIYTFGEGDMFNLKGKIFGIVSNHKKNDITYTVITIPYPTEEEALTSFQYVKQHLDPYLTIISQNSESFTFKDYRQMFGKISVKENTLQAFVNLTKQP